MGVKLANKPTNGIPVKMLKDGQIAEVVANESRHTIGRIVQRCAKRVMPVGLPYEYGWGFADCDGLPDTFRVRVLQPGEYIEVT